MEHYSERLGRNYQDEDWLSRTDAAEVLARNSGREKVSTDYLVTLAHRGVLHPMKPSYHVLLFQYKELKDLKIDQQPGRKKFDHVTDNVLRQRAFKARRKAALLAEQSAMYGTTKKEDGDQI